MNILSTHRSHVCVKVSVPVDHIVARATQEARMSETDIYIYIYTHVYLFIDIDTDIWI